MKTKNDEYLRVKQAAAILGVAPNTVRKWGAAGKIPEVRHPINSYRLYRRSDLEELIAQIERSAAKQSVKPR
jgi:excisionase family DNA binding protein